MIKLIRYTQTLLPTLMLFLAGSYAPAQAQPVTKVYVPVGNSNEVIIYGSSAENLIRRYNAEFDVTRAFASLDNSEVWLVGDRTTECEVLDAASDRQITLFDSEIEIDELIFSPDGLYAFAIGYETRAAGRQIFAVDAENYELLYPLTEVVDVGDAVVTADSRKVWVSSVTQGTLSSFGIPSFEPIETVYVGPEPVDLELINSGETMVAVCRGLAMGKKGGAQLVGLSPSDGSYHWINNQLGNSLSGLSISDDAAKLVLTYHIPMIDPPANIREFSGRLSEGGLVASPESHYLIGRQPHSGMLEPDGSGWFACDEEPAIISINLESDSLEQLPDFVSSAEPNSIGLITIDVQQRLEAINVELEMQATSDLLPDRLLELAYLQKTAGNNNEVVSTYKRIIEDYSASYAAIEAGLEMSRFTFNDSFFIQSAEYSVTAMNTLSDYMAATLQPRIPPVSDLRLTIERLALLSEQFGKDYLEDVADKYLDLSVQHPLLATLFFDMGYHLYRIDEEGTARKCFSEVKNQLTAIEDPVTVRVLSARLALATGDNTAYYKIKNMKNGPVLDGDLSEWEDVKPLRMSAAGGWFYGQAGWAGSEDLAGVIHVAYSESDLFLSGAIFDDSLVSGMNGGGDRVRFFVDLRPTAGSYFLRNDECGPGCFQFSVIAPGSSQPRARLETDLQAPYEIASSRSVDGYNFELRMPLVAFGKWFDDDLERIGLGIELLDYDITGDPEARKALGFVLPAVSPGGEAQPMLFGVAELQ